jgi:hypothetical protein
LLKPVVFAIKLINISPGDGPRTGNFPCWRPLISLVRTLKIQ